MSNLEYFAFCPGVGWKVKNNIIEPILSQNGFNKILNNQNQIITCFGGFIESFFCLSYAEIINKLYPSKKKYFNGNDKFLELIKLNGLCKFINLIDEKLLNKYPIPIFFDQENNTYFNCLFNYLNIYEYTGKFAEKNNKVLLYQLFKNSCMKWNKNYIPQLRNLIKPQLFVKLKENKKFDISKKFVLIFPDSTNLSIHSYSTLNWSVPEVRSFASMLAGIGVNTVIITKFPQKYPGIKSLVLEPKIDEILYLIKNCSVILSKEIDFLLISLLISKKTLIIGEQIYKKNNIQYSLLLNSRFLKNKKRMFLREKLNPIEVFGVIK